MKIRIGITCSSIMRFANCEFNEKIVTNLLKL